MKMIITQSFQWLVQYELVHIYRYVVMPNHIHVLWEQLRMNGESLNEYATEQKDRNYIHRFFGITVIISQ